MNDFTLFFKFQLFTRSLETPRIFFKSVLTQRVFHVKETKRFVRRSKITTDEFIIMFIRGPARQRDVISVVSLPALYHYLPENCHFLRECGRKDGVQPRKAFFSPWKHIEVD